MRCLGRGWSLALVRVGKPSNWRRPAWLWFYCICPSSDVYKSAAHSGSLSENVDLGLMTARSATVEGIDMLVQELKEAVEKLTGTPVKDVQPADEECLRVILADD